MIRITIQITDPETAEAYRGESQEIIAADLLHGSLMTACEVVSVEHGEEPARNPWKPISELGEITYMEDGSYRWTLWAGYENLRLFEVELESGRSEFHVASIDDEGTLRNQDGDYVGWQWHDTSRFMELADLANIGKEVK